MFGALMGAMLLIYGAVALVMVVAVPVVLIRRVRRELAGEAPETSGAGQLPTSGEDREDLEERRQMTQVRLRLAAEAAVRRHDEVLEEWVAHLQDEQVAGGELGADGGDGSAGHTGPGGARDRGTVDPAVQKRLLDALDAAHDDRVDPEDPALDHYSVGLYTTRVRDVEAAWRAYHHSSKSVTNLDGDDGNN